MSAKTRLRPNETVLTLAPAADAQLRFIGVIRTPFVTRDDCPRQGRHDGPECRLEVSEEWAAALDGVEAFPTLEVLYWLHDSRRDLATQSPRNDGKTTGTFALRSPVRPNPIGTSIVRLVRREGAALIVCGLDCLDGTPLLDIKPNRCDYTPAVAPKPADGDSG